MKLIYDEVVGGKTGVIIGHSMGGALAVHLSYLVGNSGLVRVFAFWKNTLNQDFLEVSLNSEPDKVVIDVVEGTAIEALPAMEALLRGRPPKFRSVQSAVEWAVKTSYIKNVDSARVSMPDQVVKCDPESDDESCQWVS